MFRAPVIGVTASLFLAAVVAVAAYDILAAVNTTRDAVIGQFIFKEYHCQGRGAGGIPDTRRGEDVHVDGIASIGISRPPMG